MKRHVSSCYSDSSNTRREKIRTKRNGRRLNMVEKMNCQHILHADCGMLCDSWRDISKKNIPIIIAEKTMSLRLFSNGWLARTVAYNLSASNLHTSCALWRTNDWKRQRKSIVIPDEGTKGETSVVLDAAINKCVSIPLTSFKNICCLHIH